MTSAEVLGLVGAFGILLTLFELLRRQRLREKYAVIWFVIAVGAIVTAVAPSFLTSLSSLIGVHVPANLLFFGATMVLLGLTLQHSVELGRAEEHVRTLAEEIALLRVQITASAPSESPAADEPDRD